MNSPSRIKIKQILRETLFYTPSEKMKNSMFKLWDKQKSKGQKPEVNTALAKSMGLVNTSMLNDWVVEWEGGVDVVFGMIKEDLDNKTFTTDELGSIYHVNIGNYDFTFELTNLKLRTQRSRDPDISVDMEILDGGVELMSDGEYYDLTRINEPGYIYDDLLWEIVMEIKDIITEFTWKVINQYKFTADSISVELIK
jgi:hypothetical protein